MSDFYFVQKNANIGGHQLKIAELLSGYLLFSSYSLLFSLNIPEIFPTFQGQQGFVHELNDVLQEVAK